MMKNTAYWIRQTHLFRKEAFECSACGYLAGTPDASCPRCGAKMKGSEYGRSWVDEMAGFEAIFED